MIPKTLFLVEQICPRTSQIYNLGAPVAVLLQTRALEAIKGITYTLSTTNNTLVLIVSKRAFITDPDQGGRANVRVAHGAFTVALVAKTAD